MLFVFGYRARKIRSKKISVLIHSSDKHKNLESCTVAVYFQLIIDLVCLELGRGRENEREGEGREGQMGKEREREGKMREDGVKEKGERRQMAERWEREGKMREDGVKEKGERRQMGERKGEGRENEKGRQ